MNKHLLYSLSVALVMVACSVQHLSSQTAAQRNDRETALADVQTEVADSAQNPASTKVYKFRSIDFPGAWQSWLFDYNGKIAVGYFNETKNTFGTAFFFKSNVYKVIPVPESTKASAAAGVNASGVIVGNYTDMENIDHGFIFEGTDFSTFDYPGAAGSGASDINDSGNIVGDFTLSNGTGHGYFYDKKKNTFTTLDYPSATITEVISVNSANIAAGTYIDSNHVSHGFTWTNGVYSKIDYPGADSTSVSGINDSGLLAGDYWVGPDLHGYVSDGKTYTTVDVPGGTITEIQRIKNNKNLVGVVMDSTTARHGIIGH
jgi:hypothetical protein